MTRSTALYIGQRLVLITFTALAVSSIVFIGVHLLPGNAFLSDRHVNAQAEAGLLAHYNLDKPLPVQYAIWISGLLTQGSLGESTVNRGVLITPLLFRELGASAILGSFALVFTIGVGLLLGVIAALRQNTWLDYVATSSAVVGYSVPNFVWAGLLVALTVTPLYNLTQGAIYENLGWGTGGSLPLPEQIPVPALALGLPYAAFVARLTRASMLEVIRQDYVRTAWAKGLRARVVILRHALRNALIPVITILGPLVTGILTGSVVIETIFGIPGIGKEFVDSIISRDYNITVGVFTFYAALIGLANLAVDLLYPVLDPRIRY